MGRRGQCAILAGRSQFVCRCCSGSGWLRHISVHNDPQAWMYQRYSSGRGCIWRRPLVAVVGVLPSLQVAVSGRSVLLTRDSAAIRMCARAFNGLYSPGPLHARRPQQQHQRDNTRASGTRAGSVGSGLSHVGQSDVGHSPHPHTHTHTRTLLPACMYNKYVLPHLPTPTHETRV